MILWQEIMLLVTEQSEKHGKENENLFLLEKALEIGHQNNENNSSLKARYMMPMEKPLLVSI